MQMIRRLLVVTSATVVVLASSAVPAQEGDPAAGQKVFNKCRACHVVDAQTNRVGPYLQGVFGRTAGTVEGFTYSPAMKDSGVVWDEETIAEYVADPKGYIPGNRMAFPGLRSDEEVTNLLAYLKEATQ